jgi:hypothetical protein
MSTRRNKEDVDAFFRETLDRTPRALISFARAGMLSSSRFLACVCLLVIGSCIAAAQEKKMDLPELISRHQESLGSAAARGAIKGRFAAGTVKYISRMGSSPNVEGTIGLVSLAPKLRYSIKFPSQQYPGEQLAFDGKHLDVNVLPGGRRTALGLVALQQDLPLKEGLLGGVLNTGWPLLKDPVNARLEYKGTRKIDGRLMYAVGYRPQKGSTDLKVTLYFDAETFRHARTEYEFQIGARMGVGQNDSTKIPESRYAVSEDFDDFKTVDGLTLPHKCKLQLSVQASMTTILTDWTLTFTQMVHNQPIEDNVFTLK